MDTIIGSSYYTKLKKKQERQADVFIIFLLLDVLEVIFTFLCGKIIDESFATLLFDIIRGGFAAYLVGVLLKYRKNFFKFILVCITLVVLYVTSIMVNQELLEVMNRTLIVGFFGTWLPAIALGMLLRENRKNFWERLLKYLPIIYIYIGVVLLSFDMAYIYQNVAYNILIFAIAVIEVWFEKKKPSHIINAILLAGLLFFTGARGPLLSFVLFAVWRFWQFSRKIKGWRYLIIILILLVVILLTIFPDALNMILSTIFPNSRIVDMLVSGSFFVSGRSSIYNYCIEELWSRWFTFGGMMSDRFFLTNTFMNTNLLGFWIVDKSAYNSVYAHNLFIELCFCFGTFWGLVFSAVLTWKIIKQFRRSKSHEKNMLVILICIGFVPLLFTSSLWASTYFWILLGFMLSSKKKQIQRSNSIYFQQ